MLTIALLAVLVAIVGTTPLLAQSPSFPDFSSTTNLRNSTATARSQVNVLRLNPIAQGQAGSAWYSIHATGGRRILDHFHIPDHERVDSSGRRHRFRDPELKQGCRRWATVAEESVTRASPTASRSNSTPMRTHDPESGTDHTDPHLRITLPFRAAGRDANTADHTL